MGLPAIDEEKINDLKNALPNCIVHYSSKNPANDNAKLVYTNTATICTKYQLNDIDMPDAFIYGTLICDPPKQMNGDEYSESKFIENMQVLMGSPYESAGYFAVEIKNSNPVCTYWSSSEKLLEYAESGTLSYEKSYNEIIGFYPHPMDASNETSIGKQNN